MHCLQETAYEGYALLSAPVRRPVVWLLRKITSFTELPGGQTAQRRLIAVIGAVMTIVFLAVVLHASKEYWSEGVGKAWATIWRGQNALITLLVYALFAALLRCQELHQKVELLDVRNEARSAQEFYLYWEKEQMEDAQGAAEAEKEYYAALNKQLEDRLAFLNGHLD